MGSPFTSEEVRLPTETGWCTGRWEFPRRKVPPHPLAVLLPDRPSRDIHGSEPPRPGLRPFLEIAWVLARTGIGSFRYACPDRGAFVDTLDTAWKRGSRHALASKQRMAPVLFGDSGATFAAERMATWRQAADPLAALLIAPQAVPDLSGFTGIHTHVILAGAAPATPDPDLIAANAARDGVALGITVIDDLTEHLQAESDWLAGRPVVHPALPATLADAAGDMLRPQWQRDARPPGTAIGTA